MLLALVLAKDLLVILYIYVKEEGEGTYSRKGTKSRYEIRSLNTFVRLLSFNQPSMPKCWSCQEVGVLGRGVRRTGVTNGYGLCAIRNVQALLASPRDKHSGFRNSRCAPSQRTAIHNDDFPKLRKKRASLRLPALWTVLKSVVRHRLT